MKKPRNNGSVKGMDNLHSAASARKCPAPVVVLHIDDDKNDTELFRAAARKANVQFTIHNVADGDQAMAYLNGRDIYADRQRYPLPVLILLDLKMPRATGFEVLSWIRNHSRVATLPVVVFSGSELQDDIQQAYAVGADSYFVKPLGFRELVNLVKTLNTDWIGLGERQLPSLAESGAYRVWEESPTWSNQGPGDKAQP